MSLKMRWSLIAMLLLTSACSLVETKVGWIDNSQKIDEDKNGAAPKAPSPP